MAANPNPKTPVNPVKTIADKLNKANGKQLDISKTKTPLRDSGTTLPPLVKGK
ncbi:hypothetical protein N5B55_05070 [Ralstonia pickettii]|uniref:hypothetical protein n=1 Tax=Ralstonia pickettii TaxID=329 RepID=UPI002714E14F|nr:hypothetical protein [Ralstonia pickettii]WKZ86326.1 hypothetical protein N5B55_05070 [Ralstonia pickettii]